MRVLEVEWSWALQSRVWSGLQLQDIVVCLLQPFKVIGIGDVSLCVISLLKYLQGCHQDTIVFVLVFIHNDEAQHSSLTMTCSIHPRPCICTGYPAGQPGYVASLKPGSRRIDTRGVIEWGRSLFGKPWTRSGKNSSRDASHHRNCVAGRDAQASTKCKNGLQDFPDFKVLRRRLGFCTGFRMMMQHGISLSSFYGAGLQFFYRLVANKRRRQSWRWPA